MNTATKRIANLTRILLPAFGLCIASSTASIASQNPSAVLIPVEPRCEMLVNPEGIDTPSPRLSWILESARRGQRQTAWQVVVATSPDKLEPGRADIWDSGKVVSDQSVLVPYAGRSLASGEKCHWRVRAWDVDGAVSPWSGTASWSMGLLKPSDWKGRWIGRDEPEVRELVRDCSWIWFPEGEPEKNAPPGVRYFRRTFDLPEGMALSKAVLWIAADNLFTCEINGQRAGIGGGHSTAAETDITEHLRHGANLIAVKAENQGKDPNPAGLLARIKLTFENSDELIVRSDATWKASDQEHSGWNSPQLDDSGWQSAKVLGDAGMKPWGDIAADGVRLLPARMLRKEFGIGKPVARATMHVSGLGLSEIYLNGKKVGDHVLSPALSEYPKRLFYVTHDVTGLLGEGNNAIGAWLGNGRFFPPRDANHRIFGYPKLMLQLDVEFNDGSRSTVISDDGWKLTTNGPIRSNNEFDGEVYDARMEMPGWAEAGFDDSDWERAQLVAAPAGRLSAQMMPPIRVTGTLKPRFVKEIKPGTAIYDMGQNMVGWCRLEVSGKAGTRVSLRHAESLKPDGSLYLANIRGARVTDTYTLKGGGTETYEPRFTYHGFRYVEVTGYPGNPESDFLTGIIVNDDLPSAGAFECSDPVINRNYRNMLWGVRGNYRSIPTDCPQRDERQGWLGDRSTGSKGEAYLFDISTLYAKWCQDMTDGQREDGSISDVCPTYWAHYNDNVTWPASAVIIPGTLWEQYGDAGVIARQYPGMAKWTDRMCGYVKDGIISRDNYGDWCVPPEDPALIHSKDPARKTAPEILATCYLHHCLKLMVRYAEMLGRKDDSARYSAIAETLKTALNRRFLDTAKGYYDNGSQTSCVLPLAFDMVPGDQRKRVFDHLVHKITNESNGHIGTGLVGGQWINRTLTRGGRPDLVHRFATQTTYPSWGYMAENGATTVWELWNGNTADPAMNSGNHVMLIGDFLIWLHEELAGIKPDPANPGFKHILMKPHPVGNLARVKASHRSPYGTITSEWRREGDRFFWDITIPVNTRASVSIPAADPAAVTESGTPAGNATGVRLLQSQDPARLELGLQPGVFRFQSTLPEN